MWFVWFFSINKYQMLNAWPTSWRPCCSHETFQPMWWSWKHLATYPWARKKTKKTLFAATISDCWFHQPRLTLAKRSDRTHNFSDALIAVPLDLQVVHIYSDRTGPPKHGVLMRQAASRLSHCHLLCVFLALSETSVATVVTCPPIKSTCTNIKSHSNGIQYNAVL